VNPLVVDLVYLARTSGLDRSEAVNQAAGSAAARSSALAWTVSGIVMVKCPSRSSSQRALMTVRPTMRFVPGSKRRTWPSGVSSPSASWGAPTGGTARRLLGRSRHGRRPAVRSSRLRLPSLGVLTCRHGRDDPARLPLKPTTTSSPARADPASVVAAPPRSGVRLGVVRLRHGPEHVLEVPAAPDGP
jgi:hypothetical protein